MADILSQEEIDALLSTVAEEGIDEKKIDSLEFVPKKVSVYDFRRPDRVSKEQLRSLRNLHDKFARNFSSALSNVLRAITDINLVSVDQMTYGEFLMSLPDPTSFNVISMIPLEGNLVLEINPSIVFPIVDKLLGGTGQPLYKIRELTDLEQKLLDGVINLLLKELEDVWRQVIPNVKFKKEVSENSPQVIQIVAQNEVVVLIVFEVKFGEASGLINLCFPAITLEPVLGKISSQDWIIGGKKGKFGNYEEQIFLLLEDIFVDVEAVLGENIFTVDEILSLKAGDTILLNKKSTHPAVLILNNLKKFEVELGISGVKKAVKVKRIIEDHVGVEQ
ncbi:flagellar motor switch protein FliM [Deferribacter desulfuricans SSM1]|uniref:Flagellar motor switch protein FliM n=1 Tax=Deferribacter desulfuricans (strain DSM 14783 / JCM 11476 / NBRC 101012 / SSM1) TaxID=639282 RepID=D3PBE1_DEFDS|nr:flagellar motor switch protein FliM [Deferribacter desulfuricans]BAI79914.1 flagellar motor switch protein FliM [Deferribacter desulfuricans SSM1]